MPQSLASLNVHLIFSTQNRRRLIRPEIEERLYAFIGGILKASKCRLLEAGGMADHTHLLVSLHRQIPVAEVIRQVKSASTKWIRRTFPGYKKFAWQKGYAAFSVSCSDVDRVSKYIRKQREHHQRKSFQEELRSFLRAHQIDFEEAKLWD